MKVSWHKIKTKIRDQVFLYLFTAIPQNKGEDPVQAHGDTISRRNQHEIMSSKFCE